MVSSTMIITIPLTGLALFMANVVVSNGQGKIDGKVEIAILWDNATAVEGYHIVSLNDYREAVITGFNNHFSLDQTKVRVAIIDFDDRGSSVRLNLTTVIPPNLHKYHLSGRWPSHSVALDKALQNAKDKIFNQSRPDALKVVFVILVKVNGTDETANVAAKELRNRDALIYLVVFCEKDENVSRLFDIANDTDVYKHYWIDLLLAGTPISFAEKAVMWLKERIRAKIPTRPPPDPTPGQPPGPKPEPGPPGPEPPAGTNAAPNLTGLYVAVGIVGTLILIGIGTCIWCAKRQRIPGKAIVFRKGGKMFRGEIIVDPEEKMAAEILLKQSKLKSSRKAENGPKSLAVGPKSLSMGPNPGGSMMSGRK